MRLKEKLDDYLNDNEYKITIKNKQINIINYDEIIDFSLTKVTIKYRHNIFTIEGKNLAIQKMIDNEVLIIGDIKNIQIS